MRRFPGEEKLHYEHRRFYRVVKGAIEKKDITFFMDGGLTTWGLLSSVSEETVERIRGFALKKIGARKASKKAKEAKDALKLY